jgi:membrane protein required for beta-lactamase induction
MVLLQVTRLLETLNRAKQPQVREVMMMMMMRMMRMVMIMMMMVMIMMIMMMIMMIMMMIMMMIIIITGGGGAIRGHPRAVAAPSDERELHQRRPQRYERG